MTHATESRRSDTLTRVLDLALDGTLLLLGAWTLLFHIGAALEMRISVVTVVWILTTPAILWVAARHPVARETPTPAGRVLRPAATASFVLAAAALLALVGGYDVVFWLSATGALVVAWFAIRGGADAAEAATPPPSGSGLWALVVIAVALAAISVLTREWVADNTYYIDHAIEVARNDGPIPMGVDSMFGDRDYPSLSGENDLSIFEGLYGGLSWLTGIHPMSLLSFVFTPWLHVLVVLVVWRVARLLGLPNPHLAAIVAVVAFFFMSSSAMLAVVTFSSRSGRSYLIGLFVPATLLYALGVGIRPTTRRFWLLASSLVGGLGATLTSFMVLPVVALVGLAAGFERSAWGRDVVRRAGGPAMVTLGHWAFLFIWATNLAAWRLTTTLEPRYRPTGAVALWLRNVGQGNLFLITTVLVLGAWLLAPTRQARRVALLAPLASLVMIAPPVVALLGATAAGTSINRVVWTLPISVLFAIPASRVLQSERFQMGLVAVAVFLVAIPSFAARPPNLNLGPPVWDVRSREAQAARTLTEIALPGTRVLAPWDVEWFVPLVSNEVYPLVVRHGATRLLTDLVPEFDGEERQKLATFVTSARAVGPKSVGPLLEKFEVTAVCLGHKAQNEVGRGALKQAGFEVVSADSLCEYWVLAS